MNPTHLEVLKAELLKPDYASLGEDYPAIAAYLNARSLVANSVTQPSIQRHYDVTDLTALLTPSELAAVMAIEPSFRLWASTLLENQAFSAVSDLLALINALVVGTTGERSLVQAIGVIVQLQNKSLLNSLTSVLNAASLISSQTKATIDAYADQTIPDPGYRAQIPGPSIADSLGLPTVTEFDIQEALCS